MVSNDPQNTDEEPSTDDRVGKKEPITSRNRRNDWFQHADQLRPTELRGELPDSEGLRKGSDTETEEPQRVAGDNASILGIGGLKGRLAERAIREDEELRAGRGDVVYVEE